MRSILPVVLAAGCASAPAPEEVALDRYYEAEALFEQGRHEEAVPHYEFVISVRDRLKTAYHHLAECHERLGRESEAVGVLERLLKVDRHDDRALKELGRLYTKRGRLDDAIAVYRTLAERHPEYEKDVRRLEKAKGH